jgi:lysophospholipase L1-like esterase
VFRSLLALIVGVAGIAGTEATAYGKIIVAFGDSTTAPRATVPKVYAQILQDDLSGLLGTSVTVYNAGVGGNTTYDALGRLNTDVRSHHPNLVIVQFGINDSWVDSGVQGNPSRVAIDAAAQVGSPYAFRGNYTANLSSIVNTLKADGARVILMTPNPVQTTGTGAEPVWQNNLLGDYAQVARNVAASKHVDLFDVWQMYANYAAVPGHSINDLLVDSEHPNQLGHQMVAHGLEAMIVPEPSVVTLLSCGLLARLAHTWRHRRCR